MDKQSHSILIIKRKGVFYMDEYSGKTTAFEKNTIFSNNSADNVSQMHFIYDC
jgi:hypothetical protein